MSREPFLKPALIRLDSELKDASDEDLVQEARELKFIKLSLWEVTAGGQAENEFVRSELNELLRVDGVIQSMEDDCERNSVKLNISLGSESNSASL